MKGTPQEIDAEFRKRIMALSPERRFLMGIRMIDAARRIVLSSLPSGLSPEERRARLFARFHPELADSARSKNVVGR